MLINAERTVLRVMSVNVGGLPAVTIDIDETPVQDFADGEDSTAIQLRPDEATYQDLVRCPHPGLMQAAGERLYSSLTSDQRIQTALRRVLDSLDESTAYPIYFRIDNPVLASLPWEALYEPRRMFLTITDRWPIGRMPVSRSRDEQAKRIMRPNLRVVAVIAAAGEATDGVGQWDALWEALKNSQCEMLVLTSDTAVMDAVRAVNAPGLAANHVGDNELDLLSRISAFCPNLVHFYCHGTAEGRPELEVEKLEDRILGRIQGSIRLHETSLLPLCTSDTVWAVTLNCCEGARGTARACSLANSLSKNGVPVVVAMRESIHFADAHLFTAAFYSALLEEFEQLFALHSIGQPIRVNDLLWGRALRSARASLRDPAINRLADEPLKTRCLANPEGSSREWTYPVLYVNRGGLLLLPRSETSSLTLEEKAKLEVRLHAYKQQRENWIQDRANPEVIAMIDTEIRRIENQLYPPFSIPSDAADI